MLVLTSVPTPPLEGADHERHTSNLKIFGIILILVLHSFEVYSRSKGEAWIFRVYSMISRESGNVLIEPSQL